MAGRAGRRTIVLGVIGTLGAASLLAERPVLAPPRARQGFASPLFHLYASPDFSALVIPHHGLDAAVPGQRHGFAQADALFAGFGNEAGSQ